MDRQIAQIMIDSIVNKHGGDDRSRKWVKMREEIIDYFLACQRNAVEDLASKLKVCEERSKQGSLF
jgi:hypothetical protein